MTVTNKNLREKIEAFFKKKHKKKGRFYNAYTVFDFVLEMNGGTKGKAELKQDVFALLVNQFKRGGFLSNSARQMAFDTAIHSCWKKNLAGKGFLPSPQNLGMRRF